ncbi:hypothetical protein Q2T41_06975 [Maribacter confluentis]|uniref:Uncharacterized protein n=1 Tax=Maribacter confluentis TaxID=1656093 RepID=A0ABT8RN96_9FLAO|nr:hypothetical protein [Maribacter confluentis]MDO1512392.1 hypothetical protein [Maribacter confluentis]
MSTIGGGFIGISLSSTVLNKTNKGIDKYNLSIKSNSANSVKPESKIIANINGFGLSTRFLKKLCITRSKIHYLRIS